jgi:DNA repair exonuclease SbcCD ATPase subunit
MDIYQLCLRLQGCHICHVYGQVKQTIRQASHLSHSTNALVPPSPRPLCLQAQKSIDALEDQLTAAKQRAVRAEEMCAEQRLQLDKQLNSLTRGSTEKGLDTARRLGRAEGDNKVLRQKVEQLEASLADRRAAVQELSEKLYAAESKTWTMAEETKAASERVEKLEKVKEENERELKVSNACVFKCF